MALHVPRAPGISQMFKEGTKHFSGQEESICRNIEACVELATSLKTAYGPYGLNKIIINHLSKTTITSDAAVILREMEVLHPAAKLLVMAADKQDREIGDGTNFVIIFAAALLNGAAELLRMGLAPSEIVKGYQIASEKTLEILPQLMCKEVKDILNEEEATMAIKASIMSKVYGFENFLAPIVAKACITVAPNKKTFDVSNVQTCQILGSGVDESHLVNGLVFKRLVEGEITEKKNAKIVVYTCPFESMQTETKGTVLIKTAEELMNFSRGEENFVEQHIKALADLGATVVVSGGKFGDMSLHFLNKMGIMAIRLPSKFDVRRVCKTVGATGLTKMCVPTKEDLGSCDHVYIDEIGENQVVIFKQNEEQKSHVVTIVIRGSTEHMMEDVQRAIDDGVNNFKAIMKDGRVVPGAGATEIELAKQLSKYGETLPGLEQYSVKKFAEALESLPKAIADNAGMKATEVIAKLYASHQEGERSIGVDVEGETGATNVEHLGILDLYRTKHWGILNTVQTITTILQVDQIIMSKPAGGPKPKEAGPMDADDD